MRTARNFVAVGCVLSLLGCSPLKVAMTPGGGKVVAGTRFEVSVTASTGCGGATVVGAYTGQCVGGRTTKPDIKKIEASPPLIVVDEGSFRINKAELYADATGSVDLTVVVQEGVTLGETTVPFEVVDPDTITFSPACGGASVTPEGAHLVLTSAAVYYSLTVKHGGESLGALAYDRLVASAGSLAVGQRYGSGSYAPSTFRAPGTAGRVTLSAPKTPSFSALFDVIERRAITELAATGAAPYDCKNGLLQTRPRAGSLELCSGHLEYTLTTLTPDVCRFGNALTESRRGDPGLAQTVTKVAAGVCRIRVDQADSSLSETVVFDMC